MMMHMLRYLQVIKQTGFMKGLFTDSEMNSDNVKVNIIILSQRWVNSDVSPSSETSCLTFIM